MNIMNTLIEKKLGLIKKKSKADSMIYAFLYDL